MTPKGLCVSAAASSWLERCERPAFLVLFGGPRCSPVCVQPVSVRPTTLAQLWVQPAQGAWQWSVQVVVLECMCVCKGVFWMAAVQQRSALS